MKLVAKTLLVAATIILLAIGGLPSVVSATSSSIYEYWNTGQDGNSDNILSANWTAMQFTSDNVSHTVETIRLYLKRTGASPGTVTVSLRHADSDNFSTGIDLTSATLNGNAFSTGYSWQEFDVTDYSLEESESYAIVIRALTSDNSNYISWGADTGGGLADAVGSHTINGGLSWVSNSPKDYLFELWGEPGLEVKSAAVFSGYLETGDLLFTAEVINTYAPYEEDNEDIASLFEVRLLDTDGITYIASTVPKEWGNRPVSIYLSADEATPLTGGSAYYIQVYGNFGSNPTSSYQLQSDNWKGTDLTYLDRWCISTARNIGDYDADNSEYYTVRIAGKGEVLDEDGGVIFDNGIPGLSRERPSLFQAVVNIPALDEPTWTDAFREATTWQEAVGADVVTMVEAWGTIVGLDGEEVLTTGLMMMGGGIFILVIVVGGGFIGALMVALLPVMLFGAWLRVIDIVVIGLLAAILAFLFVWSVWWSKT